MTDLFGQGDYDVRMEWGPVGAAVTAADVCVVVDVLSFSTSVSVAVDRGMRVYPYRWNDERARAFAEEHDAVLAVGRLEAASYDGPDAPPSLSPAGLLDCTVVPRLVLPSPNGSTIAAQQQASGSAVVAGCLRNASAVATWTAAHLDRGGRVAVIAAGERWRHDDSLRPALEDQLGAGAILAGLVARGHAGRMSPEALSSAEAFEAASGSLTARLERCVGGRELAGKGFAADVTVAAALDVSAVVPVLVDGAFVAGERGGPLQL